MKTKMNRDFFTTAEAARLMVVSVRTVQLWCDSNILNSWTSPGGHRRIEKESLLKLINEKSAHLEGATTNSRNILIVEDEPDLRFLYQMNIKQWGLPIKARCVEDGFQALVEIGRQKPDLLITDLLMPNMDGFKMLESIEKLGIQVPAIVITGASAAQIEQMCNQNEDILVLPKPVDFGLLRRLISTTLDIRKIEHPSLQDE